MGNKIVDHSDVVGASLHTTRIISATTAQPHSCTLQGDSVYACLCVKFLLLHLFSQSRLELKHNISYLSSIALCL